MKTKTLPDGQTDRMIEGRIDRTLDGRTDRQIDGTYHESMIASIDRMIDKTIDS